MIRSTTNVPRRYLPPTAPVQAAPVLAAGPGQDTANFSRPSAPAAPVEAGGGVDDLVNGFNGINGIVAGISKVFGGLFKSDPQPPAAAPLPPATPPQPVYPVQPPAAQPQPVYPVQPPAYPQAGYPVQPPAAQPQPVYPVQPPAYPQAGYPVPQQPVYQPQQPVYVPPQAPYPSQSPVAAPQPTAPAMSPAYQSQLSQLHQLVSSPGAPVTPAAPAPMSADNASAVAGSGPMLQNGETGPAVRTLQRRLKELGFDPGEVDGVYGPETEEAVKAFQRREGIEVDGVVGPITWQHLGVRAEAPKPPELSGSADQLKAMSPDELAALGAQNKEGFFAALKPAALAAEKEYGVPWQVTLAQAALESGWGKHAIGGYNIFGIKGRGPAGSVTVNTSEYRQGGYVRENAAFAKYNNFYEAVELHGKLFHNGYYDKAVDQFARDHDPVAFVRNIQGIYATDPSYDDKILSIMRSYHLV